MQGEKGEEYVIHTIRRRIINRLLDTKFASQIPF